MTVREAIAQVVSRHDLSEEEMAAILTEIMDGQATPAQIGALLTALHVKGETVEEITGAARVMRALATRVETSSAVLDTCGTGGDGRNTFNISTAAAFVAAAAGLNVAKHGNRAMSGAVGGADVLETLGAKVELTPDQVQRCLHEAHFGFLLAPAFHRAMRHAVGPRREIGIRTIFNVLGPLTNPAGARHQLLGVFAPQWVTPLAEALGRLGSVHALVVHGEDGLDEISLSAPTTIAEWQHEKIRTQTVTPEEFGFVRCSMTELQVKSAQESADIIRAIFAGTRGPHRDIVLFNAGAALYAGDAVPSIAVGIERARMAVDSGAATRTLERFVALTQTQE
jgi:anthranilate phosphoribosyltransferase